MDLYVQSWSVKLRKKGIQLKVIFFLIIILFGWKQCEKILEYPKQSEWLTKGLEKLSMKQDYYDVLFAGTSMAVTNVSAEELYLKYGIASCSIGEPEQMIFLSYYSLKEALKYQKPKVVCFDVQALFYSAEREKELLDSNEQATGHYTLDNIKNGKIKYDAVTELKRLHPTSTYYEYFSKMYYNHSNWQNITIDNFKRQPNKNIILGNRCLTGILENVHQNKYVNWNDNPYGEVDIQEKNIIYLEKIINLCHENNIDVILLRGCGSRIWSWQQYNAMSRIADEFGVDFLDLALYEEQIGFDWVVDTEDDVHHNVVGTKKWTDFLGDYLLQRYSFIDRRKDNGYSEYEKYKEKYENILNAVEQKIDLIRAKKFNQYLDTLYNMDKNENVVLIATNGEACLSETGRELLNAIGFQIETENKTVKEYWGILDDGKTVNKKNIVHENIMNTYVSDNITFEICSSDELFGDKASIKIDNHEVIQGGSGINIVVYNKACKEVLSSVFFDTNLNENPMTSRINGTGEIEYETDTNFWE